MPTQRLDDLFAEIRANLPARRGCLCEQYFTRKASDGTAWRMGPYYVLTRSVNGKTRSKRIPAKDVPRVRAELGHGKRLETIFEKIWELAEESAARQACDSKKTARRYHINPQTARRSRKSPLTRRPDPDNRIGWRGLINVLGKWLPHKDSNLDRQFQRL
jgi:hypothetical protein